MRRFKFHHFERDELIIYFESKPVKGEIVMVIDGKKKIKKE